MSINWWDEQPDEADAGLSYLDYAGIGLALGTVLGFLLLAALGVGA